MGLFGVCLSLIPEKIGEKANNVALPYLTIKWVQFVAVWKKSFL